MKFRYPAVIVVLAFAAACVPGSAARPALPPPAHGAHAMIATEQQYATQAGVRILREGGNAVDAAIAVAYALAVVDPCCGNIGGGGFMLVRMHDGRERFIDFREKAPLRANPRNVSRCRGQRHSEGEHERVSGNRRSRHRDGHGTRTHGVRDDVTRAADGAGNLACRERLSRAARRCRDLSKQFVSESAERTRHLYARGEPAVARRSCANRSWRRPFRSSHEMETRRFTVVRSRARLWPRAAGTADCSACATSHGTPWKNPRRCTAPTAATISRRQRRRVRAASRSARF